MKYTIVRQPETGPAQYIKETTSEKRARQIAATEAVKGGQVFIEWFRTTDGQQGYLNRDGHNPVGRAW